MCSSQSRQGLVHLEQYVVKTTPEMWTTPLDSAVERTGRRPGRDWPWCFIKELPTRLYANRHHCIFLSNSRRSGVDADRACGPGRQAAKREPFTSPEKTIRGQLQRRPWKRKGCWWGSGVRAVTASTCHTCRPTTELEPKLQHPHSLASSGQPSL